MREDPDFGGDSATVNLADKNRAIRRRRWALSGLASLYLRRFRLRDSALEVFFRRGKHRNFFVDFGHRTEDARLRDDFAKRLIKVVPASAGATFLQRPTIGYTAAFAVRQHGCTEQWLAGSMSNFDYLMALNTIAGRSFNDLCQYPVMPWILSQYTEDTLDLTDPKSFRDLSKPMGALNPDRLSDALDRYESMEEEYKNHADIPPFMYGSHYSTMVGTVLHFLMRLQPFASLHSEMQGGRFDVADRLFSSIPRTWLQVRKISTFIFRDFRYMAISLYLYISISPYCMMVLSSALEIPYLLIFFSSSDTSYSSTSISIAHNHNTNIPPSRDS